MQPVSPVCADFKHAVKSHSDTNENKSFGKGWTGGRIINSYNVQAKDTYRGKFARCPLRNLLLLSI